MLIIIENSHYSEVKIPQKANNKILVKIDPGYFRPTDIDELRGDSKKARRELRWKPEITFKKLVQIMVKNDIDNIS